MAFQATSTTTEMALTRIRQQAAASKTYLINQRALMVTPTVNSNIPLSVILHFAAIIPIFDTLAATPGLAQYAKDQLSDQTYDIVAEFTAMRNAMNSALTNLIGLFPKDGNGFLLYQTIDAAGIISTRTFTAAQVAPAVALVDSVIATIS